jgi:hypothetical protein
MTPYRIRGITIKDRNLPLNEIFASILPSRFSTQNGVRIAGSRFDHSTESSPVRWQSTVHRGPKGTVRIGSSESVR